MAVASPQSPCELFVSFHLGVQILEPLLTMQIVVSIPSGMTENVVILWSEVLFHWVMQFCL